jgi:hypothetical protein
MYRDMLFKHINWRQLLEYENQLPEEIFRAAIASDDQYIRGSLIERKDCPEFVLEALATDKLRAIRRTFARDAESIPSHIIELMLSNANENDNQICTILMMRQECNSDWVEKYAHQIDEYEFSQYNPEIRDMTDWQIERKNLIQDVFNRYGALIK